MAHPVGFFPLSPAFTTQLNDYMDDSEVDAEAFVGGLSADDNQLALRWAFSHMTEPSPHLQDLALAALSHHAVIGPGECAMMKMILLLCAIEVIENSEHPSDFVTNCIRQVRVTLAPRFHADYGLSEDDVADRLEMHSAIETLPFPEQVECWSAFAEATISALNEHLDAMSEEDRASVTALNDQLAHLGQSFLALIERETGEVPAALQDALEPIVLP